MYFAVNRTGVRVFYAICWCCGALFKPFNRLKKRLLSFISIQDESCLPDDNAWRSSLGERQASHVLEQKNPIRRRSHAINPNTEGRRGGRCDARLLSILWWTSCLLHYTWESLQWRRSYSLSDFQVPSVTSFPPRAHRHPWRRHLPWPERPRPKAKGGATRLAAVKTHYVIFASFHCLREV